MKNNSPISNLLTLGLLLFAALACSTSSTSNEGNSSQPAQGAPAAASTEFKLDRLELRGDDGSGSPSDDVVTAYSQADKKLHCYLNWDNPKANTRLKISWVAVDAGGAKNTVIKDFTLVTENELQNEAFANLKPTKMLPKGSYKVDVQVNDKLERSVPFAIE